MSTRGFLTEVLLHRNNAEEIRISVFLFTYITHKLKEHFVRTFYCYLTHNITFSNLFHDYDVTTLEVICPSTFRKYTKHQIKVFQNENIVLLRTCKPVTFYNTVLHTSSHYFSTEYI